MLQWGDTSHTHMHILLVLALLASLTPLTSAADAMPAPAVPYERTLVITAYYSPLPDQCCYIMGSLEEDKIMNGHGTNGADGTPVYPGMVAAPKSYAFGTRIVLPGIGTVTVHDRGGAIIAGTDSDRLDLWVGHGEEGLARAIAFGKRTVRATVYPNGTAAPMEHMDLSRLSAPMSAIRPYAVPAAGPASVVAALLPSFGEKGDAVTAMQEKLKAAGYFAHEITGFYGDVTRAGVRAFLGDVGLEGDGGSLTGTGSVYLAAAAETPLLEEPLPFAGPDSAPAELAETRRLLRGLGYYRGRTLGPYDDALRDAIVAFQRDHGLVADAASPGAGRIGPVTRRELAELLRARRVSSRAERLLTLWRVRAGLHARGLLPASLAEEGKKGDTVRAIQRILADGGFLPASKVTGLFGPVTRDAVVAFQVRRGIVADAAVPGAGRVGPATLQSLQDEAVQIALRRVRADGWQAL